MWDAFWGWAGKELREVKRAPVAFAVVLLLGLGFGWWAAQRYDADLVNVMERQVESFQRGIPVRPQETARPVDPNRVLLAILAMAFIVCVIAIIAARRNKRLVVDLDAENDASLALVEIAAQKQEQLITERDEAVVALKDKKHEYAMEVLERFSHMRFKPDGITAVTPNVTIQYCSYGQDYELAQQIQGYFTQYVKWPVTLDGLNNPALPRADKFKVAFDVGMTIMTYGELQRAFNEGNLVGVNVGIIDMVDREDSQHLIVKVFPSAPSVGA